MVTRIILYILAGISLCYSLIIYNVHSGSKFFLFWDVLCIGLVALAVCLKFRVFSKIPKAVTVCAASVLAVGLITCIICLVLIFTTFNAKGSKGLDYIIVLGAQVRSDGPSTVLRFRLEKAKKYLDENPDTVCICSGGQGENEPVSEGAGMKEYLVGLGIDESRIIVEDQSHNTRENIKNCASLIPEGASAGIITNNFHVYRALYLTRRYGMKGAEGIAADSLPLYLPNNAAREVVGLIKDLIVRSGYTD